MKQAIQKALQGLMVVPALVLGLSFVAPTVAYAAPEDCSDDNLTSDPLNSGANCAQGSGTADNLFAQGGVFQTVTNILLFLVGAISVIMLIIGGIRYVVSGGDQSAVTGAKNTILYAIVGIVVAFLAFAAVNFVITQLGNAT